MTKLPNYHLDLLEITMTLQEDSNWLNYQNLHITSSVDVISSPKIIINKQEDLNCGYQKLYILRTEFTLGIYIIIILYTVL